MGKTSLICLNRLYYCLVQSIAKLYQSTIRSIGRENGKVAKDQKTISNEIKEFYQSLFTNKNVNLNSDDAMTFFDVDFVPKWVMIINSYVRAYYQLMNVLMCLIHLRIIRPLEMMG